jgi:hypothetical protein
MVRVDARSVRAIISTKAREVDVVAAMVDDESGWDLPPVGRLPRNDVSTYQPTGDVDVDVAGPVRDPREIDAVAHDAACSE